MTKEEVLEKMEEEKESVKSKILYGQSSNSSANGCGWCFDVINHAIDLVEQLDEPKKVVIPQFMADWIEEAKEYYGSEINPLKIVYWACGHIIETDSHYERLENIYNQKLLLNAAINGYEVENKIEKYVRLKGFAGTISYLNYDVNSKEFFVDTTGLGSGIKIKFTKRWLKDYWSEYEAYNNAGLLEFEEVEDD